MNKVIMRFKPGLKIKINGTSCFSASNTPTWVEGEVVDALDTQFTALYGDPEVLTYRFYADKGRTWDFDDG